MEEPELIEMPGGGGLFRIGVISDTHIPLRAPSLPPELLERLAGVDLILHAGDLVADRVLVELSSLAPVEAVAGNMDYGSRRDLSERKLIRVGGVLIGLTHGYGDQSDIIREARTAFSRYRPRVIVFGHTHRPYNREVEGVLMFNPGSPLEPRGGYGPSCGLLTLDESGVTGEIISLSPPRW